MLASKCGLHVCLIPILSVVSIYYLRLINRISFINLSKFMFSLCLKPNYIIHTSHSLIFPHLNPSPTLLSFFWGGGGSFGSNYKSLISPSFGLKHRLFMNFVRFVHILYSIRPYENGLIKEFKHKNQCPIYKVSPTYFGKILFSWKTYLNLYLKWAMTFRSPHLFSSSFFFLEIFFLNDQVLSQHIKVFYLSHYKAHLECSLSSFTRACP